MKRLAPRLILLPIALMIVGCGSSGISATTCEDVADETLALYQRVIDDIDEEFADVTVSEFIALRDELPSLERFSEDADQIDSIAAELGCTEAEVTAAVSSRTAELTATTPVGRFLIEAFRMGGI
ncbi:MAG: hypothetical protein QNJ71_01285 [Acidimicrobiia bacterium]|nr:hypothetical protein [Acidimicrobiia bacterium]